MNPNPYEPLMSIGVAAKKLGISPESLRVYEREGLIKPYKTESKRRLYSLKDIEWITCFRNQMNNGVNIAGIRLLLGLIPCWDIKPCSESEREGCPVYMNGGKVCWLTPDRGCKECGEDFCYNCDVYRTACRAGKLNNTYLEVNKGE